MVDVSAQLPFNLHNQARRPAASRSQSQSQSQPSSARSQAFPQHQSQGQSRGSGCRSRSRSAERLEDGLGEREEGPRPILNVRLVHAAGRERGAGRVGRGRMGRDGDGGGAEPQNSAADGGRSAGALAGKEGADEGDHTPRPPPLPRRVASESESHSECVRPAPSAPLTG